jgi:putative DNA primase/helicase
MATKRPRYPGFLKVAMPYAKQGLPVFPVNRKSKSPHTENGYKDSSTDPAQIRAWATRWPQANVALDCGAAGVLILDCDGPQGVESIAKYVAEHGEFPLTRKVRSGREEDGYHYYFVNPNGCRNVSQVTMAKLGYPGLEIKAIGGYVILPGSVHGESGRPYEVEVDAELADPPDVLMAMVENGAGPTDDNAAPEKDTLEDLLDNPPSEGERNVWLTSVAGHYARAFKRRGDYTAHVLMASKTTSPQMKEDEVLKTAKSIWQREGSKDTSEEIKQERIERARRKARRTVDEEEAGPRRAVARTADQFKPKAIKWLMPYRIPIGKLSATAGWQGTGKSTFAAHVTGQVTTGKLENSDIAGPRNVLWVSTEEAVEDEILPRLMAANADLARVSFMQMSGADDDDEEAAIPFQLPDDAEHLGDLMADLDPAFVFIDPLLGTINREMDSYRTQDIRHVLSALWRLVKDTDCAMHGALHLNKGKSSNPLVKIAESSGITQVLRSVLLWAVDPESEEGPNGPDRVLLIAKHNLAPPGTPGLKYRLVSHTITAGTDKIEVGMVKPNGETSITANQALAEIGGEPSAVQEAKDFLIAELADGPVDTKVLQKAAKAANVSWEGSIRRAKTELAIESNRVNVEGGDRGAGYWTWSLPTSIKISGHVRPRGGKG